MRLEELGVLAGAGGLFHRTMALKAGQTGALTNGKWGLQIKSETDQVIRMQQYSLTRLGQELFKLSGQIEGRRDYMEAVARRILGDGRVIELLELGSRRPDGRYPILSLTKIEPS